MMPTTPSSMHSTLKRSRTLLDFTHHLERKDARGLAGLDLACDGERALHAVAIQVPVSNRRERRHFRGVFAVELEGVSVRHLQAEIEQAPGGMVPAAGR